jgi:[acyl-carrier-protein] S-malonyltransferase
MTSTLAFVFPGQGSQHVGMLSELAQHSPQVLATFATVSERLGYDLWQLIQEGPQEQLNRTEQTQAAMLTADVVIYQLMQQQMDFKPAMMAGHSLGEYAALVCAGALTLPDAAELVSNRGRLMQETVPVGVGAMAAIVGLPDDKVALICSQSSTSSEQVVPANYNTIGQVVIAGHTPAIQRGVVLAEALGARMAKIIPVSVPCHCPLLERAAQQFESYLAAAPFVTPLIPVISNVDLSIYESPAHIRRLLKEQLVQPVRWVETIQSMKRNGIRQVIESGPGRVLTGLIKRIDNELNVMSVNDKLSLENSRQLIE